MNANIDPWLLIEGDGPLVATAIHNGHRVREELLDKIALTDAQRLREEDPFTGGWTVVAPTQLVAGRSRFEFDINRSRDMAVYRRPEDAWGLDVWKQPLPQDCLERSLQVYDAFYQRVNDLLQRKIASCGRVVVLDLHSYNHRRAGPDKAAADPQQNPEVNLGTGTMSPENRELWAPLIERFMSDLRSFDYLGRSLDVRENVKFRGGGFPKWAHETFSPLVCVLSVEFKKFFMNEWTGEADKTQLDAIRCALGSTTAGILEELTEIGRAAK